MRSKSSVVISGVVSFLVPPAAYALIRPHTGADATALAVAAGIPSSGRPPSSPGTGGSTRSA
ncbi:hypothetical protein ACFQ0B_68300 [Nonomuraea thailandensis]